MEIMLQRVPKKGCCSDGKDRNPLTARNLLNKYFCDRNLNASRFFPQISNEYTENVICVILC